MAISDEIARLENAKAEIKTAIQNKNVTVSDTATLDTYGNLIGQIAMDTNASETDILNGKTAYSKGKKITGKALPIQTSASADKILNGYTAYSNTGEYITGKALSTATTASEGTVLDGYTAYDNQGQLITGTAFSQPSTADSTHILNGYTAYNRKGSLMRGKALATITTADSSSILNGKTAYSNTGELLTGSALNQHVNIDSSLMREDASAYDQNGNIVTGTVPLLTGYYDGVICPSGQELGIYYRMYPERDAFIDVNTNFCREAAQVLADMGAARFAVGSVTASSAYKIIISGLSFHPEGAIIFYGPEEMDWFDDGDEVPIIISDINGSGYGYYQTIYDDDDGTTYTDYYPASTESVYFYYLDGELEITFDYDYIYASGRTYNYVVWGRERV